MKIRVLEKLAGSFPYLVLFAYVGGFAFCLAIDRLSYLINGSILAIPAIVGSFVFALVKKRDLNLSDKAVLFGCAPFTSALCFILLLTAAVLVFSITPFGSKWGLVVVVGMYAAIFVQILSRRLLPALVLAEIMLALATTFYSTTLRAVLYKEVVQFQ